MNNVCINKHAQFLKILNIWNWNLLLYNHGTYKILQILHDFADNLINATNNFVWQIFWFSNLFVYFFIKVYFDVNNFWSDESHAWPHTPSNLPTISFKIGSGAPMLLEWTLKLGIQAFLKKKLNIYIKYILVHQYRY